MFPRGCCARTHVCTRMCPLATIFTLTILSIHMRLFTSHVSDALFIFSLSVNSEKLISIFCDTWKSAAEGQESQEQPDDGTVRL